MKKILVPCDFSDPAVQAFKFAVNIARQSKGEITLLNVVELPVMHDTVLMPTLNFEEAFIKELAQKAEKTFSQMRQKWAKDGPPVRSVVDYGNTTATIIRHIKEDSPDLVIMGTKGATGFKEYFVGSNTEKIVRMSPAPVIAVKNYSPSPIKNIVFPTALQGDQESITLKVKALQNFFKATLHVLYINTPTNFKPDRITKESLKKFAKRYMLKDFTLNIYNDPYEETGVLDFSKEVNADLIAMATHGRKGLAHLVTGSIAEDIVNHVECPIWTFANK